MAEIRDVLLVFAGAWLGVALFGVGMIEVLRWSILAGRIVG